MSFQSWEPLPLHVTSWHAMPHIVFTFCSHRVVLELVCSCFTPACAHIFYYWKPWLVSQPRLKSQTLYSWNEHLSLKSLAPGNEHGSLIGFHPCLVGISNLGIGSLGHVPSHLGFVFVGNSLWFHPNSWKKQMAKMTFQIAKMTRPHPNHKVPASISQGCGLWKGICIGNHRNIFICIGNFFICSLWSFQDLVESILHFWESHHKFRKKTWGNTTYTPEMKDNSLD